MKKGHKTKGQLIDELRGLRARIRELESAEAEHRLGAVELQRSKEFIETVMNSITDSISIIDTRDLRIVGANKAFLETLKLDAKEVIGKTCHELTHRLSEPCGPPDHICPLRETIKTGGPSLVEHVHGDKEGNRIYVEVSAHPIRNGKGQIFQVVHVARDITERKMVEDELRTLSRAVEQSPATVVITDPEGTIEYVNPKFVELTGYTVGEAIGENPRILKSGKQPTEFYEELWKTITQGREWHGEFLNKKKNGDLYWEDASISPIRDQEGVVTHFVGVKEDITERKRTEEAMRQMAYHDPLTGLPNRLLFKDRLTIALAQAHRDRQKLAVMLLDLDHFKDVNDTLGHSVGDELLRAVGKRLTGLLRKVDTVARMGGDEFLLLLPGIKGTEDAAKVAQKVVKTLRKPYVVDGHKLHVTASIGVAIYPNDGQDDDSLMSHADNAMYWAKREGRDTYQR